MWLMVYNFQVFNPLKNKVIIFQVIILAILFLPKISFAEIIPADRRINWSPGIPGGIPNYPVVITATDAPYNADNIGITNASAAIQNALNACGNNGAVYLPAGTYLLNLALNIPSNCTLRGAGPNNTNLQLSISSGNTGIYISGTSLNATNWGPRIDISSGYIKGSTMLTLSATTNLAVGDILIISSNDDISIPVEAGSNWCSSGVGADDKRNTTPARYTGQMIEIINITGNDITISPALAYTLNTGDDPEVQELYGTAGILKRNAGIEDLKITNTNTNIYYTIVLSTCKNCWVKNIETVNSDETNISVSTCYQCEVRDNYFHNVINERRGDGGQGYGLRLALWASDNLIENNIFYEFRHSIVVNCAGPGNVVGYNYSEESWGNQDANQELWIQPDLITHSSHPRYTLWEGNKATQASEDYVHGTASHNTWLRNYLDAKIYNHNTTANNHPVVVMKRNNFMSFIGNVLGYLGIGGLYATECVTVPNTTVSIYKLGYTGDNYSALSCEAVSGNLLRHGNYDYFNNSTIWDSNIIDQNIPASLYLSSKPSFFGNKQWPLFSPDVGIIAGTLPAEDRFN